MHLAFLHIEDIENLSDIAKNVIGALAIIIGAIWAYWRFLRERTRWPRAALELKFTERRLAETIVLLNVTVSARNEGRGLMELTELRLDLHRVRPLDSKMKSRIEADNAHTEPGVEADWPLIQHRKRSFEDGGAELEPGESDEYGFDFFIEEPTETVQAYAFLENRRKKRGKRRLGWALTVLHDLESPPTAAS